MTCRHVWSYSSMHLCHTVNLPTPAAHLRWRTCDGCKVVEDWAGNEWRARVKASTTGAS